MAAKTGLSATLDIQDVVAESRSAAASAAPKRRSDEAYFSIRDRLLSGVYVPGEALIIRDLADELDMSMTPVREALWRLTSEGALDASHHRSVRVPKLTLSEIQEIWAIRSNLESFAARAASPNMTRLDYAALDELQAGIAKARQQRSIAQLTQQTRAFYFTIFHKSGMARLNAIIEGLWLQAMPVITWRLSQEAASHTPDRLRKSLVNAFKKDDAEMIEKYIRKDLEDALIRVHRLLDADTSSRTA